MASRQRVIQQTHSFNSRHYRITIHPLSGSQRKKYNTFFIQLFDGIIGKEACNVISSILFGCLIYMTSRMASQGNNSLFGLSITSAILFLLIPGFHNEFLFFSALFNYLWATIATMCFILWYTILKIKACQYTC